VLLEKKKFQVYFIAAKVFCNVQFGKKLKGHATLHAR